MWELVKRSLQRERSMAGAQLGRPRKASVQRMHNEIVEAFLKVGRQSKRDNTGPFSSVDRVGAEGHREMRGGIWRAVSNLGFAIAMAIRLLNPYVLISAAFGQHRSLLAHLSARVDSMRAVLSPRTGRRRRLTAWIQDTLPQRHVPEAATAVWEDGSLLCGIVETAVPGACPGYDALSHPNTDRSATLCLGQKLVARYLGVPPVFSEEDLAKPFLTVSMERRLIRYLSAVRSAAARVEAERLKRSEANEGAPSAFGDEGLSSDCIVQSAIDPEESMLECVARGMGLILGVKGRRSNFYLYLNPNHPHRHVHRLMQRTIRQPGIPNVDEEAGAILMQIRGPDGDFGAALISTAPGSSSTSKGYSIEVLNEQWCGRIPISYSTTEENVKVSFVPQSAGIHELTLLLRGGSHVPGSPFSVSVEDSLDVPDNEGKFLRFGSGRMEKWKATSHESGLNRVYRRFNSGDSDPGVRGSEDRELRQRRRVVSRVVDFITEKMLLTEDGKLQRLPKQSRRNLERTIREDYLTTIRGENPPYSRKRYFTTVSPTRSRIRHPDKDEDVQIISQSQTSAVETCRLLAVGESKPDSGRVAVEEKRDEVIPVKECVQNKGDLEETSQVSDVIKKQSLKDRNPLDFRDHCRKILWLCDILLKHSARQESLEILNTAGDILVGKRVHPTIMEESEPEDTSTSPSTAVMAQRLQRSRSDAGGLNEVSKWKDNRRSLHTWARPDRGGSMVGGRLLHKGGNYRGIVVRNLNAEAITGAYAGGEDSNDEGDEKDTEEEEKMKQYLREDRPVPRKPHFSIPKRRATTNRKMSENCGPSADKLEPITSSDAETDSGTGITSGKGINNHIISKNKRQIDYSEKKTEAHGLGGLLSSTAKQPPPLSEKTDVILGIERKSMISEGEVETVKKSLPRRRESVGKVSEENNKRQVEGPQGTSMEKALDQKSIAAEAVVGSEAKRVESEQEKKKTAEEEDSAASEEKASALEEATKEEGKINGRPSRATFPPPLERSSSRKQSPEPPEGTEAKGSSFAGGTTSSGSGFPRMSPQSVEGVERSRKKEEEEPKEKRGNEGELLKEKVGEEDLKEKGEEEGSGKRASEEPNLLGGAKEREIEEEKGRDVGEGEKKAVSSYGQMVGRMLCTDSFPQESLEWFDTGEKGEGELEGAMETMEDLEKEAAGEAGPWGNIGTGLGFGEEDEADSPDMVGNEDCAGRITAVEGGRGGREESDLRPAFPGQHLDPKEGEKMDILRHNFTETSKRTGVGVGVGVVVAGGIFSKDGNRSHASREDEGSMWWRRRDRSRAERVMELARQDSAERHWDEISTGIDAMEDGSISGIITEVMGGRREEERREGNGETREGECEETENSVIWEEAREYKGKEEERGKSLSKDGEERSVGHSITEIPQEVAAKGVGERERHPQSSRVSKEEASGAFERRGVAKGMEFERGDGGRTVGGEQVSGKCEESTEVVGNREGVEEERISGGEWWMSEMIGAGARKIEEVGVGLEDRENEVGKLGRDTPEEGVEAKEEGEDQREKRKEVFGSESAPAEHPCHKGFEGEDGLPSVSGGRSDDPLRTGESSGDRRGDASHGVRASLKHEEIERAEEADEVFSGAENSKMGVRAGEKEGISEERGSEKGLKEAEKVARVNRGTKSGEEAEERDLKKAKGPLSTGTEVSSESAESENKYSLTAIKESLKGGGESNGRAEGSAGEGGSESGEGGEGEELSQVLVKSTKGVFLGSVAEEKCETSFQGAMEVGVEKVNNFLECLIEISKDDAKTSQGSSPKRVGEGIYGVKIALEDWMKGESAESDYLGPETEVIVGDFEGFDEGIGGREHTESGMFEVAEGSEGKRIPTDEKKERDEGEYESTLLITEETAVKAQDSNPVDSNTWEDITNINRDPRKIEGDAEKTGSEGSYESESESSESSKEDEEPLPGFEGRNGRAYPEPTANMFPDLGELFGSDSSYKMTTCTAQFNLWPSQEVFGDNKLSMESIESFLSGKSPIGGTGEGLLGNMTTFSRTTVVMSTSPHLRRVFPETVEKDEGEKKEREGKEEEEEEIILVEQDFDDRSDEQQVSVSTNLSDFQSFDVQSHPRSNSGDAFLIFESPGVTTFAPLETDTDEDNEEGVEPFLPVLEGEYELELGGEWEEGVIFLDEDDVAVGPNESRIWEVVDNTTEESTSDTAYAVVMETDSSPKHKTPVLPTGRWCPRLSMMSPVMSAISEEEADEAVPEKDQKVPCVGKEVTEESEPKYSESDKSSDDGEGDRNTKAKDSLHVEEKKEPEEVSNSDAERNKSPLRELPVLQIDIEDGFGETFSRRRSSTPSVASDVGDASADCGAAFVVSSELAVTLALGVSITQIIPPVVDPPPPLPQVEEAKDAMSIVKSDSEESGEKEKGAVEEISPRESSHSEEKETEFRIENSEDAVRSTSAKGLKESMEKYEKEDDSCAAWNEQSMWKRSEREGKSAVGGEKRKGKRSLDEDSIKATSSLESNEEEGEWILIVTPEAESNKEEDSEEEKTSEYGCTIGRRHDFEGSMKEENVSHVGKTEGRVEKEKTAEGNSFGAGKMDLIRVDMRESQKTGRDNEPSVRATEFPSAQCDGNEAVKGEKSVAERKRKQGALKDMNITAGVKGTESTAKDERGEDHQDLNAFERGLIENADKVHSASEEGIRKEILTKENENTISEENKINQHASGGSAGSSSEKLVWEGIKETKVKEEGIRKGDLEKGRENGEGVSNVNREESNWKTEPPCKYPLNSRAEGITEKDSVWGKTNGRKPKVEEVAEETILDLSFGSGASTTSNNGKKPEVMDRRDSVFDDYRFDWWESGFELKRQKKPLENQDSTGLEYYLDVDQLLNVELEATEAEVKYISAKEIMEKFAKVLESPERVLGEGKSGEGNGCGVSGTEAATFEGDLIDITGEKCEDKANMLAKSSEEINFWGDDLYEDLSKDRNDISSPRAKKGDTLDDLLFGDVFSFRAEQSVEKGEGNKPSGKKEDEEGTPGDVKETKPEHGQLLKTRAEEKHVIRHNESLDDLFGGINNWEQGRAAEKEKHRVTKGETTGEQNSTESLGGNACGRIDTLESFDRSNETGEVKRRVNEERVGEGTTIAAHGNRSMSYLGEETLRAPEVCLANKDSEEPIEKVKEKIGLSSHGIYPSAPTDTMNAGYIFDPEKKMNERIIPSKKEERRSKIETEEKITVDERLEKTDAAESSIRDSAKAKDAKSAGSDRTERIKLLQSKAVVGWEAIRVDSEEDGVSLDVNKIGEGRGEPSFPGIQEPSDERNAIGTEKMAENETREAETLAWTNKRKKERKEGEERSVGGEKAKNKGLTSAVNKFPCQSSLEEYRMVVSEAYAFLDLQESQDGKIDEDDEGEGKESSSTGVVGWDALGGSGSSWEAAEGKATSSMATASGTGYSEAPKFAGHEGEKMPEPSPSSTFLKTVKNTDQKPSLLSPTKEITAKDESIAKVKDTQNKPKKVTPDDDEDAFLAKTTVASRKEYWDRRMQEAKAQSEEVSVSTSRRPPIKLSGIVKRGRMSFEQKGAKADSATDSSDSAKSLSDSPPQRAILPEKQTTAAPRKGLLIKGPLKPSVEEEEPSDDLASETKQVYSLDQDTQKATHEDKQTEGAEEKLPKATSEEADLTSQITVLKRKELWDQKLQQNEKGSAPVDRSTFKRQEKKISTRVESTEKLLLKSSTSEDEKTEKKVPSVRIRGIVSRSKLEFEKQSSSPPESENDEKLNKEGGGAVDTTLEKQLTDLPPAREKVPPPQKVVPKSGGSVMRLTKLFSPTVNEPSAPNSSTCRPGPTSAELKSTGKGNDNSQETKMSKELPLPVVGGLEGHSNGQKRLTKLFSPTVNEPSAPNSGTCRPGPTSAELKSTGKGNDNSQETEMRKELPLSVDGGLEGHSNGQKRASWPGNDAAAGIEERVPKVSDRKKFSLNLSKRPTLRAMGKSDSLPAIAKADEDGNFVARRKKYWDSVHHPTGGERPTQLQRKDSKDLSDESVEKRDMTHVRNMWERRASLDTIQLTEEKRRVTGGKKMSAENMAIRWNWVAPVREASQENVSSTLYSSQENEVSAIGQEPRDKTSSDKSSSEMNSTMEKSVVAEIPADSLEEKSEKKSLPKESKIDKREGSERDISFEKGVFPEKVFSETRFLRGKRTPSGKESLPNKTSEEKVIPAESALAKNKDLQERRISPKKKTSPEEKAPTKKTESTDKMSSEESAFPEKKTPSAKMPLPEKKSIPERTVPQEKKVLAEKRPHPDPVSQTLLRVGNTTPPHRKESLSAKETWDSEEERKAMEYVASRKRRSSVEIRVTDDEDVCVMREFTSVPVFTPKGQMETHEEEEENREEGASGVGKEERGALSARREGTKEEEREMGRAARRKNMPSRTVSVKVSGIVASGRRRFESGPPITEDTPTPSEEVGAKASAAPHKRVAAAAEQRRDVLPPLEERLAPKGNSEAEVLPKGFKSKRPSGIPAGDTGHVYRAIPVLVEGECQRAELGEEGPAEEIPATLARGEGGDDGRSAISRRAAKGTAPMQKKKPPPSAGSSPDSESDAIELPRSFLSTPTTAIRRHSTDVTAMRSQSTLLARRRGSGDLGSPRKTDESKKRFTRARQFFETLEKGKEKSSNASQSGEEEAEIQKTSSKKKKGRGTSTDDETGRPKVRKSSTKRRSPLRSQGVRDSSESTPDSDKQAVDSEKLQQRRKSRRGSCDMIHSAPGSDVDNGETAQGVSHRRKKGSELVLRSRVFGGSERQPRVSERFNVMDLFRDVAGFGTGGGSDLSGRATPLGIPHQAAVLAALRSVEDVRSFDATSPYDLYRPMEAANDCEPSAAVSHDENANLEGAEEEDSNVTFGSPVTMHAKQEYQAEYPHLPMTSPRNSRHRSSHTDLIPRNVLLQLDNSKSAPLSTTRRSKAELF